MVQISVTNLEEAIEWYTKKLGFKLSKENYFPPVAVDLENEGLRLLLHKADKKAKIDYPNQAQSVIIFETENLKEKLNELKKEKVELIYEDPLEFPAGIFSAFRDPYGNVHEIIELK